MERASSAFVVSACVLLSAGCAAPKPTGMTFPGADWEEATPESQAVDSTKLAAAVAYLEKNAPSGGVKELVIARSGRLMWAGPEIDKVHGVWSITKAFTSAVLGLLIDDGKLTLDTPAKDMLPGLAQTYPDVTMRHFTAMTSGYRAIGDEPRGGYLHGPSQTPFDPSPEPLFTPPGSKYAYWDSAMNQFANVLTRVTGEPIEDFFQRRIADPIGMNREQWDWGDFGEIDGIVVNGGSGNSNRHIRISARELARFGHLFLNRGNWNGTQLISANWVDESVKVQVPAGTPLGHPESGIDGRGTYGYNWWANGILASGKRKWPEAPEGSFSRSGYNNNDLFVIPEWDMVIVRLGLDQSEFAITDEIHSRFLGMIGEALLDVP